MFESFGMVSLCSASKVSGFVGHLRAGRLVASRCARCGQVSFPPRADCPACLSADFEFRELSGLARLHTFTRVVAAPAGFEGAVPYLLGLADLAEGGRVLAWLGGSVDERGIGIGMELRVVPRVTEREGETRCHYTLEPAGDGPGGSSAAR